MLNEQQPYLYNSDMHELPPGLHTAEQLAMRFQVSLSTIHAHHRRGTLAPAAYRVGRTLGWTTEQVEAFAATRRPPGRPQRLHEPDGPLEQTRVGSKELGAFYTPTEVANVMARWVASHRPATVIEPSVGDGVFLRALNRMLTGVQWTAHEIDREAAERFRQATGVEPVCGDYLASPIQLADAVIGNPPFVRLRNIPEAERLSALARSAEAFGAPMESAGSVWVPFVTHAANSLFENGVLAYVLPWEVTYVRYALPLWSFLARTFSGLRLLRVKERVYPDLGQDVVVLLAEGRSGVTNEVSFETYETLADLDRGLIRSSAVVRVEQILHGERPFHKALLGATVARQVDEILGQLSEPSARHATFNIGYVTGDNKFFHPSDEEIETYRIPSASLTPTLLNSRSLRKAGLRSSQVPSSSLARLWRPRALQGGDQAYIEHGQDLGVDQRYKCRGRTPWFQVPDVRRPDLLLSVFSEEPTLLLNDAGLTASNSLLVGRSSDPEGLIRRWYSLITILGVELNVHSLGGGVLVFVPREVASIPVWRSPADSLTLEKQNQLLVGGHISEAYRLRNEELDKSIGFGASDVVEDAIRELRSWRKAT